MFVYCIVQDFLNTFLSLKKVWCFPWELQKALSLLAEFKHTKQKKQNCFDGALRWKENKYEENSCTGKISPSWRWTSLVRWRNENNTVSSSAFHPPTPTTHLFFIIGESCHKYNFCHNKTSFVTTKICLSWQNVFVATRVTNICRNKRNFVRTNMCLLCFVMTKVLSWQAYFCHDKRYVLSMTCVCHNKTFVMTKIILMAAPVSDTFFSFSFFLLLHGCL